MVGDIDHSWLPRGVGPELVPGRPLPGGRFPRVESPEGGGSIALVDRGAMTGEMRGGTIRAAGLRTASLLLMVLLSWSALSCGGLDGSAEADRPLPLEIVPAGVDEVHLEPVPSEELALLNRVDPDAPLERGRAFDLVPAKVAPWKRGRKIHAF